MTQFNYLFSLHDKYSIDPAYKSSNNIVFYSEIIILEFLTKKLHNKEFTTEELLS